MPKVLLGLFYCLIHLNIFLQHTHTAPVKVTDTRHYFNKHDNRHENHIPINNPSYTPTPVVSPTPVPTTGVTPTPTETPVPTVTPTPVVSPTPVPTTGVTPTPTETPVPTVTPTPVVSPTPVPTTGVTPTPTETPVPTVTPTPVVSPTPVPTAGVTPTPADPPSTLGNDISYPQCGLAYPSGQSFGIVGVNDGISTTTNPCLSRELIWANISNGDTSQSKVQLYVNTANPGGLNTASWPQNDTDPSNNQTSNPLGTCNGSNSLACAWQYGWNRADQDVENRFLPAAQAASVSTNPSSYVWWLDVETVNTWESGSDFAYQSNAADLEGMVAYFQSKSATVGIYSTSFQWNEIVSTYSQGSTLDGLQSWLPGADTLSGAETNCALQALTTNGKVTLTQFTSGNFDFDYGCD